MRCFGYITQALLETDPPCALPLAKDEISRLPAFVSTLLSKLGAVLGEAVSMTAAGIAAASRPSFAWEVVSSASARADPEAAANSIIAAPGRIDLPATIWSQRNETAGCVSCPTKLQQKKEGKAYILSIDHHAGGTFTDKVLAFNSLQRTARDGIDEEVR